MRKVSHVALITVLPVVACVHFPLSGAAAEMEEEMRALLCGQDVLLSVDGFTDDCSNNSTAVTVITHEEEFLLDLIPHTGSDHNAEYYAEVFESASKLLMEKFGATVIGLHTDNTNVMPAGARLFKV